MSDLSATACGCDGGCGGCNSGCNGGLLNLGGGSGCSWIWIILILFFCCGNNGSCGGSSLFNLGGNGCGNGCGSDNNGCCNIIIWLFIISMVCGGGIGC